MFDLLRGGCGPRFNLFAWQCCLGTAFYFGWEPAGTDAAEDFPGEWDGDYFTNDRRGVTNEDARALAAALRRAIQALRAGQKLTAKQAKYCKREYMDMFRELASFAEKGGFMIS